MIACDIKLTSSRQNMTTGGRAIIVIAGKGRTTNEHEFESADIRVH